MPPAVARWAPTAAVILILSDDVVLASRHWSVPVLALLDEPAHFATAAVLLASVGALRPTRPVFVALVASVAIDLDHLPLYAGAPMGAHGRPPTHSLATVAVLAIGGAVIRRWRSELLGCALGVALHLVRDAATGPGAPLLWPVSARAVAAPYVAYAAVLVTAAASARSARLMGWYRRHAPD